MDINSSAWGMFLKAGIKWFSKGIFYFPIITNSFVCVCATRKGWKEEGVEN